MGTLQEDGERLALALTRLYVVALYRPLVRPLGRAVVPPMARWLERCAKVFMSDKHPERNRHAAPHHHHRHRDR